MSRVEEPIRSDRLTTHPVVALLSPCASFVSRGQPGGPDVSHPPAMHWATCRWSANQVECAGVAGPNLTLSNLYRRTICAGPAILQCALRSCPVVEPAPPAYPACPACPAMHASAFHCPRFLPGLASSRSPFSPTPRSSPPSAPSQSFNTHYSLPSSLPAHPHTIQQCPRR